MFEADGDDCFEENKKETVIIHTNHHSQAYGNNFDEVYQKYANDTACKLCVDVGFADTENLRNHLENKHYHHSAFCLVNGNQGKFINTLINTILL